MKNKIIALVGAALVLVVAYVMFAKFYQKKELERKTFVAQDNAQLFVREYSPALGPENAEVFITEFLDPECESCRGVYHGVKKILEDYPGKIRLVVRYAAYHHNSEFAIRILESARRQGMYWETLELLFRTQPEWGSHHNPRPELIWTYLPELKLDIERIKNEISDPLFTKIIEQDAADGEALGIDGTPTFFVNGKPLEAFGLNYLREAVERELKE